MRKIISWLMALFVLTTATGIAIVWAWDRGTSPTERILLTSLAVVVVLAVHVLPALIKRPVVWLLWSVCLCVAIYSHAGFFSMVTAKSAQQRGEQSLARQAVQDQIDAIQATLATIKARPLAQVSALLSYTKDPVRIEVLSMELAEAQRAAKLRDELVTLRAKQTTNVSVADAVTELVTHVSGMSEAGVTLIVNLVTALLLELIGVMLWLEVLGHKPVAQPQTPASTDVPLAQRVIEPPSSQMSLEVSVPVAPEPARPSPRRLASSASTSTSTEKTRPITPAIADSEVESVTVKDVDYTNSEIEIQLMQAMISGECLPTVNGIRKYLNCSQSVAVMIEGNMAQWIRSLDLIQTEAA